MPYRIEYDPVALEHFRDLTARERSTVLAAIREHLRHEPLTPTLNRKRLRPNPLATWELRVERFRVLYDVLVVEDKVVWIVALVRKDRDKTMIGDEEIDL